METRNRIAAILLASLVPLAGAPARAADPPVTLRLAVSDTVGQPSQPAIDAFIAEVSARSDGRLTIEPTYDAARPTLDGFEIGTAGLLMHGDADLAVVASRAWDHQGLTTLQPLQTPFLIDDDAAAVAVAGSSIADELLASMTSAGVAGLAMWPEDLRHPVAFVACTDPIVSPDALDGLTVRAIPSRMTERLMAALGATAVDQPSWQALVETCDIQAAESGLRQGGTLPERPTVTGDVSFYPKFQVLAASEASMAKLSDTQRDILRASAVAARDLMLAEHPTDATSAAAWCANGGRVVLAGPDGIAAFRAAAAPMIDEMMVDPATASIIERIGELRDSTARSAPVEACDPAPAEPSGSPDPEHTTIVPPDGTYRVVVTPADTARYRAHPSNGGTITLRLDGDTFEIAWAADSPGGVGVCGGPVTYVGGAMRMDFRSGICDHYWMDVVWSESDAGLTAKVIAEEAGGTIQNDRAIFESHPWQRIE